MLKQLVQKLMQEAAKRLNLSDSHQQMRSGVQDALVKKHYNDGAGAHYPYTSDTFGDHESGSVVFQLGKSHNVAKYTKKDDGSYDIGDHKPVKLAYLPADVKEDGWIGPVNALTVNLESLVTEASRVLEVSESAVFQEGGTAEIRIIQSGKGAMGYYTNEALKQAAKDKVFHKGLQMFIDHQTESERRERPVGSVSKLAAELGSDAVYRESGGVGALYAKSTAFSDFQPFLNERKDSIGLSIRAGVTGDGSVTEGLPTITGFTKALSVDFVTKAGAGGKLMTVYESYRAENGGTHKEITMPFEVNEAEYNGLKATAGQVPALLLRLSRIEEQNRRFTVRDLVNEALAACPLPTRGKDRIVAFFTNENAVLPVENGVLDIAKLKLAVAEQVKDETAYLQSAGWAPQKVVRGMGQAQEAGNEPELSADNAIEEAEKSLAESVKAIKANFKD